MQLTQQWGIKPSDSNWGNAKKYKFNLQFPKQCFVVLVTCDRAEPGGKGFNYVPEKSQIGFTAVLDDSNTMAYIAIGY